MCFAIDILNSAFDQTIVLLVMNDAAQQRSQNINGDGHQENVYTQYLGCYRNFHWLKQILNKKEGDIFIHKLPWILRDKTGHLQTERRFQWEQELYEGIKLTYNEHSKILHIKDVLVPINSEHLLHQNNVPYWPFQLI